MFGIEPVNPDSARIDAIRGLSPDAAAVSVSAPPVPFRLASAVRQRFPAFSTLGRERIIHSSSYLTEIDRLVAAPQWRASPDRGDRRGPERG